MFFRDGAISQASTILVIFVVGGDLFALHNLSIASFQTTVYMYKCHSKLQKYFLIASMCLKDKFQVFKNGLNIMRSKNFQDVRHIYSLRLTSFRGLAT